jgi:hypothetical protein
LAGQPSMSSLYIYRIKAVTSVGFVWSHGNVLVHLWRVQGAVARCWVALGFILSGFRMRCGCHLVKDGRRRP